MFQLPLQAILFWIAVTLAPPDALQIHVKGPTDTWAWTKQKSGWSLSVDRSVWTIDGNAVAQSGPGKDERKSHDVGALVQGVAGHDWRKAAGLNLPHRASLAKQGNAFVYTPGEGRSTEKYVIRYRRLAAGGESDLAPGQSLIYEVDPVFLKDHEIPPKDSMLMDSVLQVVNLRLHGKDGKLGQARKLGNNQIEVALLRDSEADRRRVERLLTRPGSLEFRIVANTHDHEDLIKKAKADLSKTQIKDAEGKLLAWWVPVVVGEDRNFSNNREIACRSVKRDNREIVEVLVVSDSQNVTGQYLKKAGVEDDRNTGKPCIAFQFDARGGQLFGKLTAANQPDKATGFVRRLAIILDGEVFSAPNLMATIRDRGQITSARFTAELLRDLVTALNSGSLPVRLRLVRKPTAAVAATHLKELGVAMHAYHQTNRLFPPAVLYGPDGKTPYSWRVALLPFLDLQDLYDQYRFEEPWDGPHNRKLLPKMPAVFSCFKTPGDSEDTSFFVLAGPGAIFDGKNGTPFQEITDGTSSTLLLVEAKRDIPWTKPEDIPYDPDKPLPALGGHFEEGFLAAMADGSVYFIPRTIGETTLRRLITKADGQVVDIPDAPLPQ
jgi:hypothetical protein